MLKLTLTAAVMVTCAAGAAWAAEVAPGTGAVDVYTDNVMIVLDASGSMDGEMTDSRGRMVKKMDAAKAALLEVLRHVPATTHVGVLVFSASNVSDPWVYPLGPRDDKALANAVNRPKPYGQTPLGTYMTMAKERLLKARKEQLGYGTSRLLVVTDGEANNEPLDLVDRCITELLTSGVTVDVIGVCMSGQHTLATKVHSYRAANNPEALERAVREVFAEVGAKSDTGAASAAVFREISGIPTEVAAAAIQALASGVADKSLAVPVAGDDDAGNTSPSAATPQPPLGQATPRNPQPTAPNGPWLFMIVIVAIVVTVFILAGKSASRRSADARHRKSSR